MNKHITIPLTQGDLEELMSGGEFNWTFQTEEKAGSIKIDVRLLAREEE